MIYILLGDDHKSKNIYLSELTRNKEVALMQALSLEKETIMNYSSSSSLFGDQPVVLMDGVLGEGVLNFTSEDILFLSKSETVFIFKEEKMLAIEQKKYKKYSDLKVFENKKNIKTDKFNPFLITDSFALKDKMNTWIHYNNAIRAGLEPEAIAGTLFWKIKTMILSGNRNFTKEELKRSSSNIVSLYHEAHRGESDFVVGLEQFILESLSSK